MTIDMGQKSELTDSGHFKKEVLEKLNLALREIEDIKRMKEEERQKEVNGINPWKLIVKVCNYITGEIERFYPKEKK